MKYFGWFVFLTVSAVLSTLWQSWLYQTAINWFLSDLSLTLLSQKTVAGGLAIVRFAMYQHIDLPESNKDFGEKMGEAVGHSYLMPLIMFGVVAAIHRFMPN